MFTITFTVNDTDHSIDLQPPLGDLNELYRSGDEIVDRIEELGFEHTGEPPSFQELSRRHRESRSHDSLDLGDLSEVVHERGDAGEDGPGDGTIDGGDASDEPGQGEADITLAFVGPDGETHEGTYRSSQSLGAALADIADRASVSREQQVVLYRTAERERSLPNQTPVADLEGETLYWEVTRL